VSPRQYAVAYAVAGVIRFAAWVHESDATMRGDVERRGYTLEETTRAMGMMLDDIRIAHPEIAVGPADWSEYLRAEGLPPDFLSAADHPALHVLAARLDGAVVASALAYDFGADCGIYNVGTAERARRRGARHGVDRRSAIRRARARMLDRQPAVDADGRAGVRRRGVP
jgi:hypothetical protein